MKETEQPNSQKNAVWKEILQFAFIAFFIVIPFRIFVAQPFVVNGASMDPTFENGQYLIVDQVSYRINDPERGEVVIFRFPEDTSKFFIKRIIGLPNERVVIDEGEITIFNEENPEGFTLEEPYIVFSKEDFHMFETEDDEFVVLGDNRNNSSDSRVWGVLDKSFIVGRPIIRLLPIEKVDILPGITNYNL